MPSLRTFGCLEIAWNSQNPKWQFSSQDLMVFRLEPLGFLGVPLQPTPNKKRNPLKRDRERPLEKTFSGLTTSLHQIESLGSRFGEKQVFKFTLELFEGHPESFLLLNLGVAQS